MPTAKTKSAAQTSQTSQTSKKTSKKVTTKVTTKPVKKAAKKAASQSAPKSAPKSSAKKAPASVAKSAPKKSAAASAPAKSAAASALIAVGAPAPDFRAVDASGKTVTLASLKGKPFVLYFYPQDDTPGCTVEACDFRDNRPKFGKLGCPVLGVSPDSADSHRKFDAKYGLGFTLLADVAGSDGVPPIAVAYGVWQEKSMYGRRYMGIVRTTYVVDGRGRVAARFDKVKVEGHVGAVLEAVVDAVSAKGR
jgi:peroxiredoxin Q/BCP